ncbi:hypothetical protein [Gluconacetobacter asukensis]|uniref:Uncharacterized protein n=1 Tax=Gluconacetobacter asukensis TaxID=1017181 RepID=A0A7W4J0T1_9PROT|nr:hypothetical protein [Gluconacetobacter asukensis]MBB2172566.1 hypothetical protein [Gluconacetobacter asukensis]
MSFFKKNETKKNAVLFFGMLRNYEIPSESIKNKILYKGDCDVFYFGPKETDLPNKEYAIGIQDKDGFFIKNPKEDLQETVPVNIENFCAVYDGYIKDFRAHDKKTGYFEEISRSLRPREDWLMGLNPARMLSMFYNIDGVVKLFVDYCKKNKKSYKNVIITRTDIVTYTDFPCVVSDGEIHIPSGEGFSSNGEKHIGNASVFFYKNMLTGDYVSGGRKDSFNDQVMIVSFNEINKFCNIYDQILELIKAKAPLSPETLLFILCKRSGLNIVAHPEWAYEIYRDGKKEITSIMDIEDLKNIDRYNPRLQENKLQVQDCIPMADFVRVDSINSILYKYLSKVSSRKANKLKNNPAKFYLDSKSYMNKLPEKAFRKSLKKNDAVLFLAKYGEIKSDCGEINGNSLIIRSTKECFGVYGPFANLQKGNYISKLFFSEKINAEQVTIDVVSNEVKEILIKNISLTDDYSQRNIDLKWTLECDVSGLEVRIFVPSGFSCAVDYLLIKKIS